MDASQAPVKVDPTIDRDPANWIVEVDPPPDTHLVTFANGNIGFLSYDPPRGFTVEEIMKFENASTLLTEERVAALIKAAEERA